MFKKLLIANRGEIAVRVVRTCQEMGILTVAVYQAPDQDSMHVRLADECVRLEAPGGFMDGEALVRIAQELGAEAIHPGYGYLAEEASFIERCTQAGLAFIGPPAEVVAQVREKIAVLDRAAAAGFPVVVHSRRSFDEGELEDLRAEAERLGYPLVVKSCRGGRGRGERLVRTPERLETAVRQAQDEAQVYYGDRRVYLEQAIPGAHQIGVQVAGDRFGGLVQFGDREGSLVMGNQKIVEESPAPCFSAEQRAGLCAAAIEIARLFGYQNVGTVEFIASDAGQFFFSEIKARIQMEHPLTELRARVDLVREQIRLAAGERLAWTQEDLRPAGWAMQCRITAEDPWNDFLPSPGRLKKVRLPAGPEVRVDTYVNGWGNLPAEYDPLIAKLSVWGTDRRQCLERLRRALGEIKLAGVPTNLPLLQRVLADPGFEQGCYDTGFMELPRSGPADPEQHLRDLAVAVAILYTQRNQAVQPASPERLQSGWHRAGRRLPE